MFDLEQIREQTPVGHIDFHHQIGSTNDRGIDLINEGLNSTPTLILTENQTAGRGQRGHKWWSSQGSLTFSYIFPIDNRSFNPIPIALAVAEAIETATPLRSLKIKWPNDILVENRKISGILIETVTRPQQTLVVAGIGINVNNASIIPQDLEQLDDRGDKSNLLRPTSIRGETKSDTSMTELLIQIINRIEHVPRSHEQIFDKINHRLAFRDKRVSVKSSSGNFTGICEQISTSGQLIIRCEDGSKKKIFSGSIHAI